MAYDGTRWLGDERKLTRKKVWMALRNECGAGNVACGIKQRRIMKMKRSSMGMDGVITVNAMKWRAVSFRRAVAACVVGLMGLSALLAPAAAYAWGADGHRLVASLAYEGLSPRATKFVDALLSLEPGSTIESIATWADEIKATDTASWHYVNMPPGAACHFDAARDCPDGRCVVQAIKTQLVLLAAPSAPTSERLIALKFVVHLVPDAEQPLHAGFREDKGGNTFQVQAFGRGSNLHAVWDSGLIRNWPNGLGDLKQQVRATANAAKASSADPTSWVEDSCTIVQSTGFYPRSHAIDASYQQQSDAVLVAQLAKAVVRLRGALETAARLGDGR